MPRPDAMPPWGDEPEALTTPGLLWQQFGTRLIPIEEVRKAYFRNRSSERFRRALREGVIPLPIVRLDASTKGQGYICLFQLAAYIDWHARQAALANESDYPISRYARLHRALIDATPAPDSAGAPRRG